MLFCKPRTNSGAIFERSIGQSKILSFRSLHPKKDLNILNQWTNDPPAKKCWHFNGAKDQFVSYYQSHLKNPDAHTFIGLLDAALVCQIDVLRVQADDLGKHFHCHYHDCVLHLLTGPLMTSLPDLNKTLLVAFLHYYFSFPVACCLYAEPHIHNHEACRLLEKSGFIFIKNIMLTNKAASLYIVTKKHFYETLPTC